MYLTLGNVAKAVRRQPSQRAAVLVGYLPVTKLECFTEANDRRKFEQYRLYHFSMSKLLQPLVEAGEKGVEMVCADGHIRMVHPIVAAYVGDYPEQCLVACCKQNRCPICTVPPDERGDHVRGDPRSFNETIEDLWLHYHDITTSSFINNGLNPIHAPFWVDLPFCDIFSCFTPDLLHQIHKGVFKEHLVEWCLSVIGRDELDNRARCTPDYIGLRHFQKGISRITQWTGREAKHLESIFISLIADSADNAKVVIASRALVDFIFYASYTSHSTQTLQLMQEHLDDFHENKEAFIALGARHQDHFNFPKLHSLEHYADAIRSLGSADGYNTELPERLHIDFAKAGYRASNKKDYIAQMVTWLRRQEKVNAFTSFLKWAIPEYVAADSDDEDGDEEEEDEEQDEDDVDEPLNISSTSGSRSHQLAKHCPWPKTRVVDLINKHGADEFIPELRRFLHQNYPLAQIKEAVAFDKFPVYKRVRLTHEPLNGFDKVSLRDTIRATPAVPPPRAGRRGTPARFDPVLIASGTHPPPGPDPPNSLDGLVIGRVRAIFKLPAYFGNYPHPLAYVDYFTGNLRVRAANSGLYQVRRARVGGKQKSGVIRLDSIVGSCHLTPRTAGKNIDTTWASDTVLDECDEFYINHYVTPYMYQLLE